MVFFPTEEELRKLREETNSEMLRQELDRERQRRMELEQKVQEMLKARCRGAAGEAGPRGSPHSHQAALPHDGQGSPENLGFCSEPLGGL